MSISRRRSARVSGSVAVTTSSSIVVVDNPSRVELTITNTHATQDVYLDLRVAAGVESPNPTAVIGEGLLLKAGGGSWSTTTYTGPVAAIASGAGTLAVVDI